MTVPNLLSITGGRFEARCETCIEYTVAVLAADAAQAWDNLVNIGWTSHQTTSGSRTYAVCPWCSKARQSLKDADKTAQKRKMREPKQSSGRD